MIPASFPSAEVTISAMGKTIMYERIYADLLAKIQNGDYKPGDRLPSEKESAELYGVSRITAKKAMDLLAKEKKI